MSIAFLRSILRDTEDSFRFAQDYWREHSLSEGYAEVIRETTRSAHDHFRNHGIVSQSIAGTALGVAHLLGGLPIGLNQWALDVARATTRHGLGAGTVALIRSPVVGMVEGVGMVARALGRWASGSLVEEDSFQIAHEVTTVLGTGCLLLLGARDMGRGGSGFLRQASRVRVGWRTLPMNFGGLTPAFAGAAVRPSIRLPTIELSPTVPPPRPLGSWNLMMASSRTRTDNGRSAENGESTISRQTGLHGEGENPPALLPLNGRTPEEAALFANDYRRFLPEVAQVPTSDLPPAIRERVLELINRSTADGFEHEFFALELQDGTVLHSDYIHSRSPFRVENPRAKNRAIQFLMDAANGHLNQGNSPYRIYSYHSHPKRVRLHQDGRAFTETNSIDCRAWEGYFNAFAERLERLGFRGRLEISAGALPAGPGVSDLNPFAATFRRSLEVGAGNMSK